MGRLSQPAATASQHWISYKREVATILQRVGTWLGDRLGSASLQEPLHHAVPSDTTSGPGSWLYIFGAGTLAAFVLQVATGAVLATKYVPAPAFAYESLQYITNQALMGTVVRGMHYFGASAMAVLITIHTVRVFLTGSYKFPRELNWLTGVALLILTMAMAFTGQLLRWDQNGVWTVVVGAYFVGRVPLIGSWLARFLLAGDTVSATTLSRFFAFHVFLVPVLIVAIVGIHLYLVQYNGISELPEAGRPVEPRTYRARYQNLLNRHGRPFWPDALWKEIVFGVVVIGCTLLLAVLLGPRELSAPPDPTNLAVEPRPDWYFIWYYTLISIKPRALEDFFLVYLPLLLIVLLILPPIISNAGERSLLKRPWTAIIVGAATLGFVVLTDLGLRAPWVPDYATKPLAPTVVGIAQGPVYRGSQLFYEKGCQYCHEVLGHGGQYGPDLSNVAKRIPPEELTVIIVNGYGNMPAYRDTLTVDELNDIVAFLQHQDVPVSELPDGPQVDLR